VSSEERPPSLAQQIAAVEWAAKHVEGVVLQAALAAAAETLKTLEFLRETLP
jgi:DNA-binding FrmR family transcriptional regulator